VRAGHDRPWTNSTASKNNHPDQKRPPIALGKFLLKKNQPRLIDLALNKTPSEILQHPPFFTGQHLKSLFATRKLQKRKKKKGKNQQPPSVQSPGGTKLLQPKG